MADLIDILYYEATGKVFTKEERMKIDEMMRNDDAKQNNTKEIRKAEESSSN